MRLPNIKLPNIILNDDLDCTVTIYSKGTNIDGHQEKIGKTHKFKCTYSSCNKVAYSLNHIETIANGIIRINGDVIDDSKEYFGGVVNIFGLDHNIISIKKYRNLFDPHIVDYTEITVE